MTKEQSFFIDSLNLMPDSSICFIQAPSLNSPKLQNLLKATEESYFVSLELDSHNKGLLSEMIAKDNIQEDIQAIKIKLNEKLLFEGFDGVEYGTISKDIPLTQDYKEKYINNDFCNVSESW